MIKIKLKKLLVAILLGSLTMFIWGGLSHTVLFVGTGFKQLPNEDKVINVLKEDINGKGLYFFPGKDFRNSTKEQDAAFMNKYQNGPVGMIIYRPVGGSPLSVSKLMSQFIFNIISVSIITIIASLILLGYWRRVFVITLLGLLTCTAVSSIYWNFYEFPTSFFIAQIADMVIGFFLAGLVICRIIPKPALADDTRLRS